MAEIKFKTKEEIEAEKKNRPKTELEVLKETVDGILLAQLLEGGM